MLRSLRLPLCLGAAASDPMPAKAASHNAASPTRIMPGRVPRMRSPMFARPSVKVL